MGDAGILAVKGSGKSFKEVPPMEIPSQKGGMEKIKDAVHGLAQKVETKTETFAERINEMKKDVYNKAFKSGRNYAIAGVVIDVAAIAGFVLSNPVGELAISSALLAAAVVMVFGTAIAGYGIGRMAGSANTFNDLKKIDELKDAK